MLAHCVIIVCSGKSALASTGALDRLIETVTSNKKSPILVIGPDGDELLRHCTRVDDCELVFDPNFEGGFFSGVKAGLHATQGAAFVVPLTETLPPARLWTDLEAELRHLETPKACDLVRATMRTNEPTSESVLSVVTRTGAQNLKALPASTDWSSCDQISVRTIQID